MQQSFEEFTETNYRYLLRIAKKTWKLISFNDYKKTGKLCLWRHDIDLSIQRAYRFAQIEAEESVKSTYFLNLHSDFYNPLETENYDLLVKIQKLGHNLGIHFEPAFYNSRLKTDQDLLDWLTFEQDILQKAFQTKVEAFSIHNPDVGSWPSIEQDEIGGMVNAYGQYFKQNYGYCSDSNGYWRFRRLKDVLEAAEDERLQVLTHPGWWTPEAMSPRDRISRCIEGRAAKQHHRYDELLQRMGRQNIR
jgi:hypothetical protein